jgi:formate/nitrite transporter FocA (FNT family)
VAWSRAAIAGLLFALGMCTYIWIDRAPGFDQLAIRFAVYFLAFTTGLKLIVDYTMRQKP